MTWLDDDDLEAHFSELRRVEAASAPAFRVMAAPAETIRSVRPRRLAGSVLWVTAAASLLLAAGLTLRRANAADRILLVASSTPPDLASWQSPTAGLLAAGAGASPTSGLIFTSVLDGVMPELDHLDGAIR